ncbi:calcium-binding protein [Bradyrhizobium sp. SRL28]|uniref:calcium-binding protein n=1 Tax=Bradyrhizobium sp. SRL28 TaxID=2836178 RepID=UPI001BDF06C3|nr:calcium-binding protein [Bradyrhizobium sp. SRL28]MBT1516888.1 calcium-binding protein [Bradyrhizobium sp. SRL28]
MATGAFDPITGVLTVVSDSTNNVTTVSRNVAGAILIDGGAVPILGGTPTVANTTLIQMFGLEGNDNLNLDESNGALPRATIYGGTGNDVAAGGSGADSLFGEAGDDQLFGRGGADLLFGGTGNDTLTGGDGDDQVFGEDGNDRLVWNPGDDSDLFEGGSGIDTAEVNGGDGSETFTVTPNGSRVRFDRVDPAPFALDIGTTENLVLNMNGGDDIFSASGNLSPLIQMTVDGGAGNDTIGGGNGADLLLGGDGNDRIDGNQGNDVAFLGTGNDLFIWDPGDGSDTVEGQAGFDALTFNGANASENFVVSADGDRGHLFRDVGNINMDLNDVEAVVVRALGGADTITVGNTAGTDISEVSIDLAPTIGGVGGDGQIDSVIVNGTNANDTIQIAGVGADYTISGASAFVSVLSSEAQDQLTVNGLGGNDSISAASLSATVNLTLDGGAGNDTIISNSSANTLIGGDGNDYLIGQGGDDTLIDGSGLNTLQGGSGDDLYAVQLQNDTVFEFAAEGADEVQTFLASFTIPQNIENLVFVGDVSHTGIGNSDNNRFTGAGANDTFTGAGGADTFDYRVDGNGLDTITDFDAVDASAGHDLIDLSGRGLNFASLSLTVSTEGTTIGIPGGDAVFLRGVTTGINAGDFLF